MIDPFYALLTLFGGLAGLIVSSNFFVDGCASLSRSLGMSTTMIGLTVVAFGTSAPEIIVSIEAARDSVPSLAIGNAIGSNIANIGLVLGLTAIITDIKTNNNLLAVNIINPIYKSRFGHGIWLVFVTFVAVLFLSNQVLSLIESITLILMTFLITIIFIKDAKYNIPINDLEINIEIPKLSISIAIIYFLVGLILLVLSANILINGAVSLARFFQVDEMIIGLTIIALGTSLPELAACLSSVLKGYHGLALGNIIGSNILNLLTVMAIPGLLTEVILDSSIISRDIPVLIILTLALIAYIYSMNIDTKTRFKIHISRLAGLFFLGIYVLYYLLIFIK